MRIGGLQKLTLIDYPRRVACTVFLIGCNFQCPWCYNPELVLPDPPKFSKRKLERVKISEKIFFQFLKQRKKLLEGVVVCGGEPTIHKNLPEFIKKIKKFGYLVKLDTNGSNPEILEKLIDNKLIDYVAMDIKAPIGAETQNAKRKTQNNNLKLKTKYEQAMGVRINLKDIKKSIEIIKNSGVDYEFRTTVVPGIHTKEDIIQIAKEISFAKKYFLQNFWPDKTIDLKFEKIKPYSDEWLLEVQKSTVKFCKNCQIRQ